MNFFMKIVNCPIDLDLVVITRYGQGGIYYIVFPSNKLKPVIDFIKLYMFSDEDMFGLLSESDFIFHQYYNDHLKI